MALAFIPPTGDDLKAKAKKLENARIQSKPPKR